MIILGTLLFSLLIHFASISNAMGTCTLYDPPSPGIQCVSGSQVMQTLSNSPWAWMLELYSSWCGHCQHFAPRLKEMARDIEPWSGVVRVAVLECTGPKDNQDVCTKMDVQGYPTIRFFRPFDSSPLQFKNAIVGSRDVKVLRHLIVDHVISISPAPTGWPDFRTLENDSFMETVWVPTVLIFEEEHSYVGKEVILDFSKVKHLRIRRVSNLNVALVRHYSILEFPSAVVEFSKGHHHIIPGHSADDARSEFREKIDRYLQEAKEQLGQTHGGSHDRSRDISHVKKSGALSHHKASSLHHGRPLPPRSRVDRRDLLSAISYALRAEVPLHGIIAGPTYSCLFNFISLLEQVSPFLDQAFTGVSRERVSASLRAVRMKLEGRNQNGFITSKDWHRIMDTKLDSTMFPNHVSWHMCNGSRPHLRGYSCGLWVLMHTLTVLTLPLNHTHHTPKQHSMSSVRALTVVTNFVSNFFSCEVCRQHFREIARGISRRLISDPGDAILWLWEAHNAVNARLSQDENSGDPLHPKHLFPSIGRCPYCYLPVRDGSGGVVPTFNNTRFESGEGLVGVAEKMLTKERSPPAPAARNMLHDRNQLGMKGAVLYMWNRTAVLLYLWNYYHLGQVHGNGTRGGMERRHHSASQSVILQAAWPRRLRNKHYLHRQIAGSADSGTCVLPYVVCVVGVSLLVWVCWRKRRCRALAWVRAFPR